MTIEHTFLIIFMTKERYARLERYYGKISLDYGWFTLKIFEVLKYKIEKIKPDVIPCVD